MLDSDCDYYQTCSASGACLSKFGEYCDDDSFCSGGEPCLVQPSGDMKCGCAYDVTAGLTYGFTECGSSLASIMITSFSSVDPLYWAEVRNGVTGSWSSVDDSPPLVSTGANHTFALRDSNFCNATTNFAIAVPLASEPLKMPPPSLVQSGFAQDSPPVLQISWNTPDLAHSGYQTVTGYQVRYRPTCASDDSAAFTDVLVTTTSVVIPASYSTTYEVSVSAINCQGNSIPSDASTSFPDDAYRIKVDGAAPYLIDTTGGLLTIPANQGTSFRLPVVVTVDERPATVIEAKFDKIVLNISQGYGANHSIAIFTHTNASSCGRLSAASRWSYNPPTISNIKTGSDPYISSRGGWYEIQGLNFGPLKTPVLGYQNETNMTCSVTTPHTGITCRFPKGFGGYLLGLSVGGQYTDENEIYAL